MFSVRALLPSHPKFAPIIDHIRLETIETIKRIGTIDIILLSLQYVLSYYPELEDSMTLFEQDLGQPDWYHLQSLW